MFILLRFDIQLYKIYYKNHLTKIMAQLTTITGGINLQGCQWLEENIMCKAQNTNSLVDSETS